MGLMTWGASEPRFLADGERFWFVAGPPDSSFMMLVDPAAGTMVPLLDVERTRTALASLGAELQGRALPFEEFEWLDGSEERITFSLGDARYVLDRTTYKAIPAPDSLEIALARREPRPLRRGLFLHSLPIREVPTPDERRLATVHGGDLWLRSATAADSVLLARGEGPQYGWDLEGARWSPDGARLAVFRVDRRETGDIPLVGWTRPGTPIDRHPFSMVGEPLARPELHIVSAGDGAVVRANLGGGDEPYIHIAEWHPSGHEVYVLRMNRLMNHLELLAVDARSGSARVVITERSDTFLWGLPFLHGYTDELREQNLVVVLDDGERLLWTSDRGGVRRIELYRTDGTRERALAPDSLLVGRLEGVDEDSGLAYFTATRPHLSQPYDVALYAAPLDGGPVVPVANVNDLRYGRLTRSGRFLVLQHAGLDRPPTLELRRADGSLVRTLWTAETSLLDSLGWTPPERFTARAADGETEIHGMVFRPTRFDAARRYPVIEYVYAGPQLVHTPQSMLNGTLWISQWLAEQGYVVVTIDGRGTPERGKRFQDVVHGRFGQFETADHAAALQQAAASRPYMDLSRVGIFGHSLGGYFTLRALLTRPDLYKVGVASAPNIDLSRMRVWAEAYMGCLPESCPDAYAAGDNTSMASRLKGRLLILHGTHDTHTPFGEVMRMVEAFNRAGRQFDLLILPDANHVSFLGPSWLGTVGDYFGEHLPPVRERQRGN